MSSSFKNRLFSLGVLRLGLLSLALLSILVPIAELLLRPVLDVADTRSGLEISATLIAPVMAPLLMVVIIFDMIMSRVRASDISGSLAEKFRFIGRIELIVIGIMLVYWIPFFISIT